VDGDLENVEVKIYKEPDFEMEGDQEPPEFEIDA